MLKNKSIEKVKVTFFDQNMPKQRLSVVRMTAFTKNKLYLNMAIFRMRRVCGSLILMSINFYNI